MAGNFKYKEHAYKEFEKNFKEGDIKNLLLLCGKEEYLVSWSQEKIVKKYINKASISMDYVEIDALESTEDDIQLSILTPSMLSEKKVVVVNNIFNGRSKVGDFDFAINESVILIFKSNEELKSIRKNKILDKINKEGRVYDFSPLEQRQLKAFIEKRIKSEGKAITPMVLSMLISESPYYSKESDYTLLNLEKDISKLIAHSGDEITKEDVINTISDSLEHDTFAFLDAISRNHKEEAFRLSHELSLSGENFYKLLGSITSQVEILLQVKELRDEGKSQEDIRSILKIHEFRIKKAVSSVSRYERDTLKRILISGYSLDEKVKSGKFSPDLAMEMFIMGI